MASSKKIQIYGKNYSLKSSSSEVDAEEVASYVDAKMKELANARSKTSTLDLADPRRAQYCTGTIGVKNSCRSERRNWKKRKFGN